MTHEDPARKYIPKPKEENKSASSDQSSENKHGVLRFFNKEMPVNQAQRIVLGGVLGYIIFTVLFPPWVHTGTSRIPTSRWTSVEVPGRTSRGGGADFVFDLPYNATVDAPMMLVHIIAAVVIGAIAFLGLSLKSLKK
jgi:hypothetical protein